MSDDLNEPVDPGSVDPSPVESPVESPAESAVAGSIERGELVTTPTPGDRPGSADGEGTETITEPAKVMRIGSMVKQLLEEIRAGALDEASRERLAEIYERSVVGLTDAMSPDLSEELRTLTLPFRDGDIPSESEIRVAKAQLVGWLEGLFHGIQATLFAQQLAARQQLEQMRQLPPGSAPGQSMGQPGRAPGDERPGTYL